MALRVWLPLNGNLENKGVGNVTISGTGTFVNDGKLGKGYTGGPISMSQNFLTTVGTICFWIKVKTDAAASVSPNQIFSSSGTYGRKWDLFLFSTNTATYPHKNSFHSWGCVKDTSTGSANGSFTYNGLFPNDVWVHVAVAHDTTKQYIYVNGSPYATVAWDSNGTFTFDGICYFANTNSSSIIYNDLRIYDECLSQKQIKEISKGLVAHYKLEGTGANPNLALNTLTTSPSGFYDYTGKASASRITDDDVFTSVYKIDFPEDTATYSNYNLYTTVPRDSSAAAQDGKTYTLSFKIKASKPLSNYKLFYEYNNKTIETDIDTNWKKIILTGIANNQYSALYLCHTQTNRLKINGGSLYIAEVKLELGDTATNWIPNTADTTYTALGYNNMIARDVSGNGHNGTVSGTLSYNVDSPRYSGSTTLTNVYISSPAGAVLAKSKDFTINGWFYHTSGTNYYASAESYNTSVCLENGRFFVYPASGGAYVGTWSATNNVWQMLTLVHNSAAKTLTLYVNGVQTAQITTDGTVYPNETLNIGGRQNTAGYTGSMSDVRIYATALTADDILTLYKTSGIIDNKGNVYAYEFKEE